MNTTQHALNISLSIDRLADNVKAEAALRIHLNPDIDEPDIMLPTNIDALREVVRHATALTILRIRQFVTASDIASGGRTVNIGMRVPESMKLMEPRRIRHIVEQSVTATALKRCLEGISPIDPLDTITAAPADIDSINGP